MIKMAFDDVNRPNLLFQDNNCDRSWPYTVPCRLIMYLDRAGVSYCRTHVDHAPWGAWYPVGLGWFHHDLDYFSLIPNSTRQKLKTGALRVLFYYHEGDDPVHIKKHIDNLVLDYQLPESCYLFISANSCAKGLENFVYFADHEFFFRHVNRAQPIPNITVGDRAFKFTALNRSHKWWRASAMADLDRLGILSKSLWSYNTANDPIEIECDNPLELDCLPDWRSHTDAFLSNTPRFCDELDGNQQNQHHNVNLDLFHKSYCHIVFETHFDVDQSHGVFLTEKTFKPIKFGQPFLIAGPQGSLAELREMGYRVFDGVIDNSYDLIFDNTQRWLRIRETIEQINSVIDSDWLARCLDDLLHNQQVFAARCYEPLQKLVKEITCR